MKKQNRIKLLTLLSCLFYCCCTDTLIQEINTTTSTNSDILSRAKLIMHNYENTFSLPNILKRSDTITSRSIDLHYAIDAIPIWDEAWEEENGEENILFVPLQNSKELYSRIVVKEGNIGSNYFSKSFSRCKRLQDYALCSFLISSTFAPNYKRVKNGYSRTKVH